MSAGIDGDGKAEWVISPEDLGGPPTIIVSLVGGTPTLVSNPFGISDSAFRGGEQVAIGNVNGDGFLDVVCIAAAKGWPRLAIFDARSVVSTGLSGTPAKLLSNDIFVADPASRAGSFIAAGRTPTGPAPLTSSRPTTRRWAAAASCASSAAPTRPGRTRSRRCWPTSRYRGSTPRAGRGSRSSARTSRTCTWASTRRTGGCGSPRRRRSATTPSAWR